MNYSKFTDSDLVVIMKYVAMKKVQSPGVNHTIGDYCGTQLTEEEINTILDGRYVDLGRETLIYIIEALD